MNELNITLQLSVKVLFHSSINPQRRRQFLYYSMENCKLQEFLVIHAYTDIEAAALVSRCAPLRRELSIVYHVHWASEHVALGINQLITLFGVPFNRWRTAGDDLLQSTSSSIWSSLSGQTLAMVHWPSHQWMVSPAEVRRPLVQQQGRHIEHLLRMKYSKDCFALSQFAVWLETAQYLY